jgi:putative flippase GtrA
VAESSARRDFVRFVVVGLVATAVSAALFNLLVHSTALGSGTLAQQPLIGFVASNALGMTVSFVGTRWWVFRDRRPAGATGGLAGFVAVNVVSWSVPLGCLALSRYVLQLSTPVADNLAANVIGLALGTVVRFWALRVAVFAARRPPDAVPDPERPAAPIT